MASKPVELPISAWAPPSSPLRIEYSTEVMEEIRARAVEGFYRLTRGGVEIAGLLLGAVQHDSIRILAQLPLEIEYAHGPVFSLSPRDMAYIRKLVETLTNPRDPDGNAVVHGYRALGFYVSHSRSGMALTETELELLQQLFPHAWQAALLLKPSRSPEMAAAFFVRQPNGELPASEAQDQFIITPAMGERRARPARTADPSLQALADAARPAHRQDDRREVESVDPESQAGAPASPPLPTRPSRPAPPVSDLHEARLRAMRLAAENPNTPPPDQPASAAGADPIDEDALARRALPNPPSPPPAVPSDEAPPAPQVREAPDSEPPIEEDPVPASRTEEPATRVPPPPLPRPLAAALEAQPVPLRDHDPVGETEPAAEPSPEPTLQPEPPQWDEEEVESKGVRATSWLHWAIPAIGLALMLILGYLVYHALNSAPPTVVFYTRDAGDRLEVVWQLKGLSDARSAVITIRNGNEIKSIDLIRTGQLSGVFTDPVLRKESEVFLDVERTSGEAIHRSAPLIASDSVVAQLDNRPAVEPASDSANPVAESPEQPSTEDPGTAKDLSLSLRSNEPILATPVVTPTPEQTKNATPASAARPETTNPASNNGPASRQPTARELQNQRSAFPPEVSTPSSASRGSSSAPPATVTPEAPLQAGVTEAPPARPEPTRTASTATDRLQTPLPTPTRNVPQQGQAPSTVTPRPSVQAPPPAVGNQTVRPQPTTAAPASAAAPAPRVPAGRVIWTGQLKKNQSLQIAGKGANQGVVNAALPGKPIRINVLPGELTPQGLIVYTANPKYRNPQDAVEPPGPTNGWNQTRYRYDPARANSLIVTAIPNQTNDWQGITVRNDDKNTNVVVIDWQVVEP